MLGHTYHPRVTAHQRAAVVCVGLARYEVVAPLCVGASKEVGTLVNDAAVPIHLDCMCVCVCVFSEQPRRRTHVVCVCNRCGLEA